MISSLTQANAMAIFEYLGEIAKKENSEIQRLFWNLEEYNETEKSLNKESIFQKILLSSILARESQLNRFRGADLKSYLHSLKQRIGKEATISILNEFIEKLESEYKPFSNSILNDIFEHNKAQTFINNQVAKVGSSVKYLEGVSCTIKSFLAVVEFPSEAELISKHGREKFVIEILKAELGSEHEQQNDELKLF